MRGDANEIDIQRVSVYDSKSREMSHFLVVDGHPMPFRGRMCPTLSPIDAAVHRVVSSRFHLWFTQPRA